MYEINFGAPGEVGVAPREVKIITDQDFDTITTAGWLTQSGLSPDYLLPTDYISIDYNVSASNPGGDFDFFRASFASNGEITLETLTGKGEVTFTSPSIANYIAAWSNTTGNLQNGAATVTNPGNINAGLSGTAGTFSSFPGTASKGSLRLAAVANTGNTITTISNAAMGQASTISIPDPGASTANFILSATSSVLGQSVAGTLTVTSGGSLVASSGNIQAGTSGAAGTLVSYPGTAARGSLRISAVANTGDTINIITNDSMGQASTFSLPDPGQATAKFGVFGTTSLPATGNLLKAVNALGLLGDAGFNIKSGITSVYAGGGTSNTFTATGLTASSIVNATIRTSTNQVAIAKALPGTDQLTITFTADPGASTTVQWSATSVAVA